MKLKRTIISIVALMLAVCLMPTALAATWYLEDGDITVIANENGQSVKQGSNSAVADSDTVITQRDSEKATDNTITVSTEGDAEANITIKDINIASGADSAIDVGDSNLNLTVEGENKLNADGDSAALRVSSGDLTIDGTGSLTAEHNGREGILQDSAKIGSNAGEDMTGNIHITGDVTVTTGGNNSVYHDSGVPGDEKFGTLSGGAGIGGGSEGNMNGTINIRGNAKVIAASGRKGAGIGAGDEENLNGTVTITDNADVTAVSGKNGAGIGSGYEASFKGTIIISGNAKVTARTGVSEYDGNPYTFAAALGATDDYVFNGNIMILGNAKLTTGVVEKNSVTRENPLGKLLENMKGYIGSDCNRVEHYGHVFISDTATINGISGTDKTTLNGYINGGNGTDIIPAQVEVLPNGDINLITERDGITVSDTMFNGSTVFPTEPGEYIITKVVTVNGKDITVPLGTLIIPEPEPAPRPEPMAHHTRIQLYRVADKQGRSIAYKAVQKGGVLTITTDEKEAKLIIERGGLFALSRQGITKIVFVTASQKSVISVSAAMEKGSDEFVLLHGSRKVKLTIAGAAVDADGILIKE